MSSLLDGIDISLCLVKFLLGIEQCLLVLAIHLRLVLFIGVDEVGEGLGHFQVGNTAIVECERHVAFVVCVHDKVGCDLLQVASHRLTERGTGLRVEAVKLIAQCCCLLVGELQGL